MKRFFCAAALVMTAAVLYGCSKSNVHAVNEAGVPNEAEVINLNETEETWTMPETSKYTIPEDAETGEFGGPGAMETTPVDYSYYPKSKRPNAEAERLDTTTLVCFYREDDGGVFQDFDTVETCDAESVIQLLMNNKVITAGTVVESFEIDGRSAKLKLNKLEGMYRDTNEDKLVSCIVNTFLDNFMLSNIELTVGDKNYGVLEYIDKYMAT